MIYEKPVVIAVHPSLISELKLRKEIFENETGRKTRGGLTCFSEMAANELKMSRMSGDEIMKEILKIKDIPIKKFVEEGVVKEFVSYDIFKKIFILSSALNKRKDQKQLKMEIIKIKGMNKNEVKYLF